MNPWLANLILVLLPVALCLASSRRKLQLPAVLRSPLDESKKTRQILPLLFLAMVPLSLLALAHTARSAHWAASLFSTAGALLGGYLLFGRYGAALAALAAGIAWLALDPSGAAFDLAALAVGAGSGFLLSGYFGGARAYLFLVALSAVDLAVVGAHLSTAALFPASLTSGFPGATPPPVFSGVVVSGFFLGGLDLACAVFAGQLLARGGYSRFRTLTAYLTLQAFFAFAVMHGVKALPAVLVPTAALLLGRRGSRYRSSRAPETA